MVPLQSSLPQMGQETTAGAPNEYHRVYELINLREITPMTFHVIIPQRLANHFVTTSRPLRNKARECGGFLFCTATISHVLVIGDFNSNQHRLKRQDGGEYEIPLHPLGDSDELLYFVAKVAKANAVILDSRLYERVLLID